MGLGFCTGFIYLIVTLTFDRELQHYCERSGFILRQSRSKKFYLFFFTLFCFTVNIILYFSMQSTWTMPQDWVVNATYGESESCSKAFAEQSNSSSMGLNGTFEKSSILFVVVGLAFG